jgi:excisionase family DNA binding protein
VTIRVYANVKRSSQNRFDVDSQNMKRSQQEWYFSDHPLGNRDWPISTRQLANYLRVTPRTLATWRREGRIPFWKINARLVRYSLNDVEAALGKPDE